MINVIYLGSKDVEKDGANVDLVGLVVVHRALTAPGTIRAVCGPNLVQVMASLDRRWSPETGHLTIMTNYGHI